MAERREFIGTYEHMGGGTYSIDIQWALLGEAEEIIRCENCIHFYPGEHWPVCRRLSRGTHAKGYCHWGERK